LAGPDLLDREIEDVVRIGEHTVVVQADAQRPA
jgi:hypothetical protein